MARGAKGTIIAVWKRGRRPASLGTRRRRMACRKKQAATVNLDEGPQSRNPLSLLDGPERARMAEPQLPLLPAARGEATSSRFFSKYATTRSTISGSIVLGRKPVSASNFSSDGTRRCMSSNPGS